MKNRLINIMWLNIVYCLFDSLEQKTLVDIFKYLDKDSNDGKLHKNELKTLYKVSKKKKHFL